MADPRGPGQQIPGFNKFQVKDFPVTVRPCQIVTYDDVSACCQSTLQAVRSQFRHAQSPVVIRPGAGGQSSLLRADSGPRVKPGDDDAGTGNRGDESGGRG
jgi:hypothetical protein